MPPLSKQDQARTVELRESLADLRDVVEALEHVGVSQRAVGGASGVNVGYLSQLLSSNGAKVPSSETVRRLLRGLTDLVEGNAVALRDNGTHGEAERVLAAVGERLGIPRAPRPDPASPVRPDSPAYVSRSCDRGLEQDVNVPNDYLISGPPESGRTTLARKVEALADARDHQVVYVDLSDEPRIGHAPGERALRAIVGAAKGGLLAQADDPALLLEAWLTQSPYCSLVILDNANAGPADEVEALLQLLRGWHNRRSSPLPANEPYRRLATWIVMTGRDVRHARYASTAALSQSRWIDVKWFTRPEVEVLARAYVPVGLQPANAERVAVDEAFNWFGGQPFLTHHYLHQRARTQIAHDSVVTRPGGAFRDHLVHLANLIRLDEELANALGATDEHGPPWTPELDQMGVVDRSPPAWSSAFYRDHLPSYVADGARAT